MALGNACFYRVEWNKTRGFSFGKNKVAVLASPEMCAPTRKSSHIEVIK